MMDIKLEVMSWDKDLKLLEDNGWDVECESPFEIRAEDGSFASGNAAYAILASLKEEADIITATKMDIERVTMALSGRIVKGNIEDDFDSLAQAISEQVEVDVDICKEIMKQDLITVIAECFKQFKKDDK